MVKDGVWKQRLSGGEIDCTSQELWRPGTCVKATLVLRGDVTASDIATQRRSDRRALRELAQATADARRHGAQFAGALFASRRQFWRVRIPRGLLETESEDEVGAPVWNSHWTYDAPAGMELCQVTINCTADSFVGGLFNNELHARVGACRVACGALGIHVPPPQQLPGPSRPPPPMMMLGGGGMMLGDLLVMPPPGGAFGGPPMRPPPMRPPPMIPPPMRPPPMMMVAPPMMPPPPPPVMMMRPLPPQFYSGGIAMPTPRGKSQEASALPPKGRPSAYHQLSKLDDPLPPNLRKLADPGWRWHLHGRMCAAIALWRIEIACDRMERKLGRITEADGTRRPPRLPVAIIFFEKFAKRALLGVQLGISNKKQAFMYVRCYNREIGSFLKKWPRNSIAAATDEPNAATPPAENRQADVVHPPRRQNVAKKLCEVTELRTTNALSLSRRTTMMRTTRPRRCSHARDYLLLMETAVVLAALFKAAPAARTTRPHRPSLRARSCKRR